MTNCPLIVSDEEEAENERGSVAYLFSVKSSYDKPLLIEHELLTAGQAIFHNRIKEEVAYHLRLLSSLVFYPTFLLSTAQGQVPTFLS